MTDRPLRALIGHLRHALGQPDAGGLDDAELLKRWLTRRDQAAFEVLVWRYGPMVLNVCQRLLHHRQDIEDAFQATFLIFVRKAASIRKREGVGGWLYRVAYRVAVRAGSTKRRQQQREHSLGAVPAVDAGSDLDWGDVRPVLDEEIHRLALRYRAPFLLCYLQGRTNAEAARELGCPEGTVASRLARARELLRQRLLRRGITAGSAGFAFLLARNGLAVELPETLARGTVKAALGLAGGTAASRLVPSSAVYLTEGVLRTMFLKKVKMAALFILVVGVLGGSGLVYGLLAQEPPAPRTSESPSPEGAQSPRAPNLAGVFSPQEGILVFLGTPLKADEKVPAERIGTVKLGDQVVKYRKLRVGDTVEEGQILGQLDDELARVDMEIKQAEVRASQASVVASDKTRDEAQHRYYTQLRLQNGAVRNGTSEEDVRGAKLAWDRYIAEANRMRESLVVAQLELKKAQTIMAGYEIRCRVHGVIKAINVRPGEAVRKLEPVFSIKLPDE